MSILTKENLSILHKNSTAIFIDLNALKNNFKSVYESNNSVNGVVLKADSYNLNTNKILPALYEAGCRDFLFHTILEIESINKEYKKPDINFYILGATKEHNYDLCLKNKAIPTLISLDDIAKYSLFSKKTGEKLPAILQVDTGLTRLGITKNEQEVLIKNPHLLNDLDIRFIYSHLANADEVENDYNLLQQKRFLEFSSHFPHIKRSFSASYATVFQSSYNMEFIFDFIRWGFVIYGVHLKKWNNAPMQPVVHFYSTISQIQEVKKGVKVGYGSLWEAKRDSIVGTINAGYADGILRCATDNGGYVIIEGYKAPYIGRISMDMSLIDLTDIPKEYHNSEVAVQIIGNDIRPDVMSTFANLNPISSLVALRHRYPWVYLD